MWLALSLSLAAVAILSAARAAPQAGPDRPGQSAVDQRAVWERLKGLVGSWKGKGEPGPSEVEQTYELILGGRFLLARTKSVSSRETHEDWEILSYDTGRKTVVLRQFVSEGYVNRFVLEEVSEDGGTLVFVTEACEGAPQGFRARQTLALDGADQISQQLELAPPGRPFGGCVTNTLKRQG
jgi:hypothetical protein